MKYATGKNALGICARSGRKMRLLDMVDDGELHLLVDPAWADIYHPQKKIINLDEGIALKRPAPDNEDDSPGSMQSLADALGFEFYFGGDRELTLVRDALLLEDSETLTLEDGTPLVDE